EPGDDSLLDLQRVQEIDDIDRKRTLLTVPRRLGGQETRGAVAAQMRHDHPETGRGQHRSHVNEGVYVVGPAVQQDDRGTSGWSRFGIADIEDSGVDLLDHGK